MDEVVWRFALAQHFTIVTKDSDFQERSQVTRPAPCVVWIRRGNCSTADIEAMLRKHAHSIAVLGQAQEAEFLILL
jgi:predicted nuclease of predicted toxin-antitoxin system